MALVVIGSAKAAPGVTTLTVALAALCPGPTVAADLDPEGGDLGLRYRAPDGGPLNPEVGLLSLAVALRGDHAPTRGFRATSPAPAELTDQLPAHRQTTAGGLDVLLGVSGPDQAVGLGPLWTPLARALAASPATVFADCGRIGAASPAMPVVREADAVIMVARAELEELSHLRERLRWLTAALAGRFSGPARLGVVLITGERDRAAGPRTEQLLRSSGVAVPVLGTVTDDPKGAARLRGVGGGRADRTTLIRSVRALVPQVAALAGVVAGSAVPEAGEPRREPTPAPPEFPAAYPAFLPPAAAPAPAYPASGPPAVDLPTPSASPEPAPATSAQPAAPQPSTGRFSWRRASALPPGSAPEPAPEPAPEARLESPPEPAPEPAPAAADNDPGPTHGEKTRGGKAAAVHGGETWRVTDTPPSGTGWPTDLPAESDPYGLTPAERRP